MGFGGPQLTNRFSSPGLLEPNLGPLVAGSDGPIEPDFITTHHLVSLDARHPLRPARAQAEGQPTPAGDVLPSELALRERDPPGQHAHRPS